MIETGSINPPNTLRYVYDVSPNGAQIPKVGDLIFTGDTNGHTFCRALTDGDVSYNVGENRLDSFLPQGVTLNLHQQKIINLPKRNIQFLQKVIAQWHTPCTQSYINILLDALHQFKVILDIPGDVITGNAIPWFGNTGLGTQYILLLPIDHLIGTYIVEIP